MNRKTVSDAKSASNWQLYRRLMSYHHVPARFLHFHLG
jgi:hypothetical protein